MISSQHLQSHHQCTSSSEQQQKSANKNKTNHKNNNNIEEEEDRVRLWTSRVPIDLDVLPALRQYVREAPTTRRSVVRRVGGIETLCASLHADDTCRSEVLFTLAVCSDKAARPTLEANDVAGHVRGFLAALRDVPEELETTLFAVSLLCLNCPAFRFALHGAGVTKDLVALLEEEVRTLSRRQEVLQREVGTADDAGDVTARMAHTVLTAVRAICDGNYDGCRHVIRESAVPSLLATMLECVATRPGTGALISTLVKDCEGVECFLDGEALAALLRRAAASDTEDEPECRAALYVVVRAWPHLVERRSDPPPSWDVYKGCAQAMCDGAVRTFCLRRRQGKLNDELSCIPMVSIGEATLVVWEVGANAFSPTANAICGLELSLANPKAPNGFQAGLGRPDAAWTWCLSTALYDEFGAEDDDARVADESPQQLFGCNVVDQRHQPIQSFPPTRLVNAVCFAASAHHPPVTVVPVRDVTAPETGRGRPSSLFFQSAEPTEFWGAVVALWVPTAVNVRVRPYSIVARTVAPESSSSSSSSPSVFNSPVAVDDAIMEAAGVSARHLLPSTPRDVEEGLSKLDASPVQFAGRVRRSNTPTARFSGKKKTPRQSSDEGITVPVTPISEVKEEDTSTNGPPIVEDDLVSRLEKDYEAQRRQHDTTKRELALARHRLERSRAHAERLEEEAQRREREVRAYVRHIAALQQALEDAGIPSPLLN
eukprot:PhM_4_TR14182/c0_g1_i2/m.80720